MIVSHPRATNGGDESWSSVATSIQIGTACGQETRVQPGRTCTIGMPGTRVTAIVERSPGPEVECPTDEKSSRFCGRHEHGGGSVASSPVAHAEGHADTMLSHAQTPLHTASGEGAKPTTTSGAASPAVAPAMGKTAAVSGATVCAES